MELCLEDGRSRKNTLGKHAVVVNTKGHSIRVLNERALVTVVIVVVYVAAIQLAVRCSELYFARCWALKRTGTFASESKVMCLF